MFRRIQGRTKFLWLPVLTSTTFTKGDVVGWDQDETTPAGKIIRMRFDTLTLNVVGVIRHTIAATDSDYATARLVEVEVPTETNVVWEADVTSGLVAADRGKFQDIEAYATSGDAGTVDRGASVRDHVQCVKVVSTTKGHFILNAGINGFGAVGAA